MLMDPEVIADSSSDVPQKVETASGEIDVVLQGVLFARIIRDDGESVVIRANALLVPDLQADHLKDSSHRLTRRSPR